MKIAIQDANFLVDLEMADLLDLYSQLGIETYTSDLVRAEIKLGNHIHALRVLDSGAIQVHSLSPDELNEVAVLSAEVRGPSFTDCTVLFLAVKHNAMLLSGDRALRKFAKIKHIEPHGTLWLFDLLIEKGILNAQDAVPRLQLLLNNSRYLPRQECETRLSRWRGL
ncbi:MAG TPA: hypothetical protein VK970_01820 [Candidatus Methylacidiphilales bacterium]|nr:hypothetical protein [Candidatus Methylacidiphilales bacterium]